ncbi:MAG: hypothetical protein RL760_1569, partial [Candidatus Eisenbacteria bacterium]
MTPPVPPIDRPQVSAVVPAYNEV